MAAQLFHNLIVNHFEISWLGFSIPFFVRSSNLSQYGYFILFNSLALFVFRFIVQNNNNWVPIMNRTMHITKGLSLSKTEKPWMRLEPKNPAAATNPILMREGIRKDTRACIAIEGGINVIQEWHGARSSNFFWHALAFQPALAIFGGSLTQLLKAEEVFFKMYFICVLFICTTFVFFCLPPGAFLIPYFVMVRRFWTFQIL